jgi:hypothetical protein
MMLLPWVYLILYVGLCWLLGYLGRHAKFSFWGNFWVSIIFTPIIGIIVLLAQDIRPEGKKPTS